MIDPFVDDWWMVIRAVNRASFWERDVAAMTHMQHTIATFLQAVEDAEAQRSALPSAVELDAALQATYDHLHLWCQRLDQQAPGYREFLELRNLLRDGAQQIRAILGHHP